MATRQDILDESSADGIRRRYLKALANLTGRDTLIYATRKRIAWEDTQGFMSALKVLNGKKLDLILHTEGGSPDAAEQIVQYLRCKYTDVRIIVPLRAMSAGTLLACSANSVLMGKHSALGPIDPQLTFQADGIPVAAHSIIDEFKQAEVAIRSNPRLAACGCPG